MVKTSVVFLGLRMICDFVFIILRTLKIAEFKNGFYIQ